MTEKMKTTAPVSSVGADGAQPNIKKPCFPPYVHLNPIEP